MPRDNYFVTFGDHFINLHNIVGEGGHISLIALLDRGTEFRCHQSVNNADIPLVEFVNIVADNDLIGC
jgi:hypothetical protein